MTTFYLLQYHPESNYQHLFSFLFLNLSIYFNWRLITLQYYSGFCHTLTWISHGCTRVPPSRTPLPPPCPSHPSGSFQCTNPERPASFMEPGLAIYFTYGNIHISMLFSQIIPLLPSLTGLIQLPFSQSLCHTLRNKTSNKHLK